MNMELTSRLYPFISNFKTNKPKTNNFPPGSTPVTFLYDQQCVLPYVVFSSCSAEFRKGSEETKLLVAKLTQPQIPSRACGPKHKLGCSVQIKLPKCIEPENKVVFFYFVVLFHALLLKKKKT